VAAVADVRTAIGFSSFAVLLYYAITNVAAWTLDREQRRWPRALSALGVLGCVVLVFTLPTRSIIAGGSVMACGVAIFAIRSRIRARKLAE
jgi:APA family basic amino acid/polyamine antiporter